MNAKVNWVVGERDRLYLSMYQERTGLPIIRLQTEMKWIMIPESGLSHEEFDKDLNWQNRTGVLRWNHLVNDKIFSNLIISRSSFVLQSIDRSEFEYSFPGSILNPQAGFDAKEFKSGIEDIAIKLNWIYAPL